MTPKQQGLYLALWRQAADSQGWSWWPAKQQKAKRYAIHALAALTTKHKSDVAQGKIISSKELTNPEVTEVIRILKALAAGTPFDEISKLRNALPDNTNRRLEICVAVDRLAIQLLIMNEGTGLSMIPKDEIRARAADYIKSMARDIYGTEDWRNLPIEQHSGRNLHHLQLTLKTRMRNRYHFCRKEGMDTDLKPFLSMGAEEFCRHVIQRGPVFFGHGDRLLISEKGWTHRQLEEVPVDHAEELHEEEVNA